MNLIRKAFKRLHYPVDIIAQCVRWYLAYSLSLRDLEEMMTERSAPMGRARQRCCLNRLLDPASPQRRFRLTARPAARWDMPHRRVDTRIK